MRDQSELNPSSIRAQSVLNPWNSSIQDQKVLKKGSIQINNDVTSRWTFQSSAKPMIIRFKPPTPFEMDWSWLDHFYQMSIKIYSTCIAFSKAMKRTLQLRGHACLSWCVKLPLVVPVNQLRTQRTKGTKTVLLLQMVSFFQRGTLFAFIIMFMKKKRVLGHWNT